MVDFVHFVLIVAVAQEMFFKFLLVRKSLSQLSFGHSVGGCFGVRLLLTVAFLHFCLIVGVGFALVLFGILFDMFGIYVGVFLFQLMGLCLGIVA